MLRALLVVLLFRWTFKPLKDFLFGDVTLLGMSHFGQCRDLMKEAPDMPLSDVKTLCNKES